MSLGASLEGDAPDPVPEPPGEPLAGGGRAIRCRWCAFSAAVDAEDSDVAVAKLMRHAGVAHHFELRKLRAKIRAETPGAEGRLPFGSSER